MMLGRLHSFPFKMVPFRGTFVHFRGVYKNPRSQRITALLTTRWTLAVMVGYRTEPPWRDGQRVRWQTSTRCTDHHLQIQWKCWAVEAQQIVEAHVEGRIWRDGSTDGWVSCLFGLQVLDLHVDWEGVVIWSWLMTIRVLFFAKKGSLSRRNYM